MNRCKECEPGTHRPAPHPGPRCATHHRAVTKARRVKATETHRVKTYGVTPDRTAELIAAQRGLCPVCSKPLRTNWVVDHDHSCCPGPVSCGRCVRGICHRECNRILGYIFRDDPVALERAAAYLRSSPVRRQRAPGTHHPLTTSLARELFGPASG